MKCLLSPTGGLDTGYWYRQTWYTGVFIKALLYKSRLPWFTRFWEDVFSIGQNCDAIIMLMSEDWYGKNYNILMLFVIMLKQTTCSITSTIMTEITVEELLIFLVASPIGMSGKHWSKLHHALTGLGPNCVGCGEMRPNPKIISRKHWMSFDFEKAKMRE